jgi:hypothetical protein
MKFRRNSCVCLGLYVLASGLLSLLAPFWVDSLPWAPYDTLGASGQYRINQMMGEVRFKSQGFSLLSEMHLKEIVDKLVAQDDPLVESRGDVIL